MKEEIKYPHKFVSNNSDNVYSQIVWCEKCGLIAYHTNRPDYYQNKEKEIRETPCPYPGEEDMQAVKK